MRRLRVLGLYEGLGGFTGAFRERGHRVVGVEKNPEIAELVDQDTYHAYLVEDVRNLDGGTREEAGALEDEYGPFDLVLASPPCQTFSVMTISNYHSSDGYPDHPLTHERLALVHTTHALIQRLDPRAWLMENPTGMLRRQEFMNAFERRTVTYCQYGHFLRKSTDLWGGFPPTLSLRKTCSNGDPCHEAAPSSSNNGVQREGKSWEAIRDGFDEADLKIAWTREGNKLPKGAPKEALRSLVPHELSLEVCKAMEAFDGHWEDHSDRHRFQQKTLLEVTS